MDEEANGEAHKIEVHMDEVTAGPEDPEVTEEVSEAPDLEQSEPPKTFAPQPIEPEFAGKPSKTRKLKKWMIITPILLVLIIGSSVGAYYLYGRNVSKTQTNKTSGTSKIVAKPKVTDSLMPSNVTSATQDAIMAKYPTVLADKTKVKGNEIAFEKTDTAPYWKIDGEKTYVNYSGDGGSSLETYFDNDISTKTDKAIKSEGTDIAQTIIGVLDKEGFTKPTDNVYNTSGSSAYIAYIKDGVVCVASSLADEATMNVPIGLSCGQVSKYNKNLENYKDIEPYAKAYAKSGDIHVGDVLTFRELKVGMKGYKNASVDLWNAGQQVGGAIGLFYKTPSNSDWNFFKGTQAPLPCTDYNTSDMQYSFAYESCYDSTKTGDDANNTVASYYKLQP